MVAPDNTINRKFSGDNERDGFEANCAKNTGVQELHIAIIGANGSGKSALTVKYMTRRYISEYDPHLEDTYCKHEAINGRECMLWIMDTVEGPHKDPNRYLAWADILMVVYSITNKYSFDYAERLLRNIAQHDHSMCIRQHLTYVIGNKTDLDRYRQVSKSQGTLLASTYGAELFETNTTEEYVLVKSIFHRAICDILTSRPSVVTASEAASSSGAQRDANGQAPRQPRRSKNADRNDEDHSPSPRQCGSDPEQAFSAFSSASSAAQSPKRSFISSTPSPKSSLPRRSKSPSVRLHDAVFHKDKPQQTGQQGRRSQSALPPPKKSSSAMKLLKLFQ